VCVAALRTILLCVYYLLLHVAACREFLLSTFAGLLQLTIHGAKDLKAVNVSGFVCWVAAAAERLLLQQLPTACSVLLFECCLTIHSAEDLKAVNVSSCSRLLMLLRLMGDAAAADSMYVRLL
jgi:hypothetical protein